MSLTSPQFLIFLACISGLGFFVAQPARKYLLIAASLVFVAAFNWISLIVVLLLASLNFLLGRQLPAQRTKALFRFSLLLNGLAIVLNNYFLAVHGRIEFSFGPTWLMCSLKRYSPKIITPIFYWLRFIFQNSSAGLLPITGTFTISCR